MTQTHAGKPDRKESGLVQRLRISVRALPNHQPHVLLACSGGQDSVGLARLLAEMRRFDLLDFSIAHIHHGQHHRADDAADAVTRIGDILDVPVVIHRLTQQDFDNHPGLGMEEAMRRERYLALAGISRIHSANYLALGHHETDQAETILLHLMRGAGVDGLAGMREIESRTIPWWTDSSDQQDVVLWRPLLGESAQDIADYASDSGLPVVADPTNADTAWRRNAIRHQVLPLLEEIAVGSTAAIARSANLVTGDASLIATLTLAGLEQCLEDSALDRKRLLAQPPGMQQRIVRSWILGQLPTLELTSDRVLAVLGAAVRNRGGAIIEIGGSATVTLRDGLLHID